VGTKKRRRNRSKSVKMPFGKYRGIEVDSLPEQYLEWLWQNIDLREPLYSAVRDALFHHEDETPAGGSTLPAEVKVLAKELITVGYRMLALKHHPDRGGRHVEMVRLNRAKEWLEKVAA
jgi:hypothetical protein